MPPRAFTAEQANALLPDVRPLVERLVEHREELRALQGEREQIVDAIAGNGGRVDAQRIGELDERIVEELRGVARCVNGIHGLGAVVKDPDTGLVDFPARRRGEDVFLCWRLGEDEIAYWHGLEEGFAGRKPLPLE